MSVDPLFEGARLHVNRRMAELPDGWGRIIVCMLFCLRWLDPSVTRWPRIGRSPGYYLSSILVGFGALVKMVLGDQRPSHLHLAGHAAKGTYAIRRFFAVSAVASLPAEALHEKLMTDIQVSALRCGVLQGGARPARPRRGVPPACLAALGDRLGWALRLGGCPTGGSNKARWSPPAMWKGRSSGSCRSSPSSFTPGDIATNLRHLKGRALGDIAGEEVLKIRRPQDIYF